MLNTAGMEDRCFLATLVTCADSTTFHSKNLNRPEEGPVRPSKGQCLMNLYLLRDQCVIPQRIVLSNFTSYKNPSKSISFENLCVKLSLQEFA